MIEWGIRFFVFGLGLLVLFNFLNLFWFGIGVVGYGFNSILELSYKFLSFVVFLFWYLLCFIVKCCCLEMLFSEGEIFERDICFFFFLN